MAQMKALLLLLIVASIPVMYADSSAETLQESVDEKIPQEQEDDPDDVKGIPEDVAEIAIENILKDFEGLYIPALPTINVNFGEVVSISLALAQLNLTGISDVTVTEANLPRNSTKDKLLEMTIPIVALNVGHYSSGGHILNLPFSGEGPLLWSTLKDTIFTDNVEVIKLPPETYTS